ncbi:MAG: hypothetical protein KOO63_04055 [Bacteroidales bacterium]|nr:hypothetical protein [Candidatus Latescibacterota bacterium]
MRDGVTLHGNATKDYIYVVEDYPVEGANNLASKAFSRPGGIHNLERALCRLGMPQCEVVLNPAIAINKIVILINTANSTRTSIVDWKGSNKLFNVGMYAGNTHWHHFAYIDALEPLPRSLHELKDAGCILSADLAGVRAPNTPLELFDYVFVSEEDNYNVDGLKAIVHRPDRVYTTWNNASYTVPQNPHIKFTLGAGDILAAVAIKHLIELDGELPLDELCSITEDLLLEEQCLI